MIYFIAGAEEREFEYKKILEKIIKANSGIKERYFDMAQNEEGKFYEALNFVSMFGGKEILVAKRAENIKKIEKFIEEIQKFNLSSKEIIIDYEDEKLDILKKVLKTENIEVIGVKKQNRHETLKEICMKELDIIESEALELTDILGYNIHKIKNEIDKIKIFLNGESYNIEKIRGIISPSMEYNIFDMGEKLLDGKKKEVIGFLKRDDTYMLFLSNFSRDIRTYLKMKYLYDEKKLMMSNNYSSFSSSTYPGIKKYFSDHPYVIFKKIYRLSSLTTTFLKEKLRECVEAEKRIKSGETDDKTALEIFILKF